MVKAIRGLAKRIQYLATRKLTWEDENGKQVTVKESWRAVWAMFGIHSWRWKWVRKYGALPCGCTRNPLTRRIVLYRWRCEIHGARGATS